MSLSVCKGCSARYAPSLDRCPHCRSTERTEETGGPLLPFLDVTCDATGCPTVAAVRRVHLRQVAIGVLEQPVLVCARCGNHVRVVGSWQPSISSEQETDMAKITVHTGASNEREPVDADETPAGEVDQGEDTAPESPAGGPDTTPATAEVTRPSKSASKAEWVAFAQQVNQQNEITDVDPETLTKTELIDLYGDQE